MGGARASIEFEREVGSLPLSPSLVFVACVEGVRESLLVEYRPPFAGGATIPASGGVAAPFAT